jgi:hypothetical protein
MNKGQAQGEGTTREARAGSRNGFAADAYPAFQVLEAEPSYKVAILGELRRLQADVPRLEVASCA